MASQMVAATGRNVHGSQNFLVLNIASGDRQKLSPKAQFPEFTSRWVFLNFFLMRFDRKQIPLQKLGFNNSSPFDRHQTDRAIFKFERESSGSTCWNIINLAGRQGCDVWSASTQPVTLLGFLSIQVQVKSKFIITVREIDFDPVRFRHSETEFLGIATYVVIIYGETAPEDNR